MAASIATEYAKARELGNLILQSEYKKALDDAMNSDADEEHQLHCEKQFNDYVNKIMQLLKVIITDGSGYAQGGCGGCGKHGSTEGCGTHV